MKYALSYNLRSKYTS